MNNKIEPKYIVLQGKCNWAFVQKPTNKYKSNEQEYCLDLDIDQETEKLLLDMGLKRKIKKGVKDKQGNTRPPFLKFKRDVVTSSGNIAPSPAVVDSKKNPMKEIVGNGSTVKVKLLTLLLESGLWTRLEAVQVIDLVPFGGNEEDLSGFEVEDGYVETAVVNKDEEWA